MFPFRRENILVSLVHDEFAKYADVFRSAMPSLRKLHIEKGFFAQRTSQLFAPVETIKLGCAIDPTSEDFFSEEQLPLLKNITLGKAAEKKFCENNKHSMILS